MKKGFTMIELIFVIVILGILAAVAIPRLAATRDDANIAKAATEIATAVQDFGTYYTANGSYAKIANMTNVQFEDGDQNFTVNPNYQVDGEDCIELNSTDAQMADGNFTLQFTTGATGLCKQVQTLAADRDLNKTYSFGGQKVQW